MKKALDTTIVSLCRILSAALSLILGVFCDFGGAMYGPAPEYGMPHADYEVDGKVSSGESGLPIPGISLSLCRPDDSLPVVDAVCTNTEGRYAINFIDGQTGDTWLLRARDIDSAANGRFIPKDSLISILDNELNNGDGRWYLGHGIKTVDIELEPDTGQE